MTTFVLKKYAEKALTEKKEFSEAEQLEKKYPEENTDDKVISINTNETISEIVAKALHENFKNPTYEVIETNDDFSTTEHVNAVSSESIKQNALETFKNLNKSSALFIYTNNTFTTTQEEWFLLNASNKAPVILYTTESFISYLKARLNT